MPRSLCCRRRRRRRPESRSTAERRRPGLLERDTMEGMDLTGKKIAILVDTMYQEMEVWYPLYRFQEAGATVITIGAKAGETYGSKLGYPVKCQISYDDARAADF